MTCTALALTLMKPAMIIKLSRPPHSRQSIIAEGNPIFRYSPRSWQVSLVKKKKLSLRSVMERQKSVIIRKFRVNDISVARDAPTTPSPETLISK